MKHCTWTGPERIVAGSGKKIRGDSLTLPAATAKDLQARGLVKINTAHPTKRATTEGQEGGE